MINVVTIVGTVGDDPLYKEVAPGSHLHAFRVATKREWIDKRTGNWKQETDWVPIVAWNIVGEMRKIAHGDVVCVEGRIQSRPRGAGLDLEVMAERVTLIAKARSLEG